MWLVVVLHGHAGTRTRTRTRTRTHSNTTPARSCVFRNPTAAGSPNMVAYEKVKRDADRRRKLLAKWFSRMKKITDGTKTGATGEIRMQNRVRFAVKVRRRRACCSPFLFVSLLLHPSPSHPPTLSLSHCLSLAVVRCPSSVVRVFFPSCFRSGPAGAAAAAVDDARPGRGKGRQEAVAG